MVDVRNASADPQACAGGLPDLPDGACTGQAIRWRLENADNQAVRQKTDEGPDDAGRTKNT